MPIAMKISAFQGSNVENKACPRWAFVTINKPIKILFDPLNRQNKAYGTPSSVCPDLVGGSPIFFVNRVVPRFPTLPDDGSRQWSAYLNLGNYLGTINSPFIIKHAPCVGIGLFNNFVEAQAHAHREHGNLGPVRQILGFSNADINRKKNKHTRTATNKVTLSNKSLKSVV